jgi:hypothetical protein
MINDGQDYCQPIINMMDVVRECISSTCCKIVLEEQDITVKGDRTLSFDRGAWNIDQCDRK